jgi:RNA polymerase sigma factor (sigma-70 family)
LEFTIMLDEMAPTKAVAMTERELFTRYVQEGSREVLEEIVLRYSRMVYSVCFRSLNDKQAADDATQATFIAFAHRGRTLKPGTQLSGWLYLTARNCARHINREVTRRQKHEREAIRMNVVNQTENAWDEIRPLLDVAIEALPAVQREVIVMRFFNGMSEADVARETGCPIS